MRAWLVLLAAVTIGVACTPLGPKADIRCPRSVDTVATEDLMRYPDQYVGRCFRFSGEVKQRVTGEQFVIDTGPGLFSLGSHEDVLAIGYDACVSNRRGAVLEGDHVDFVAQFDSVWEGETVLGAGLFMPLVYCVPTDTGGR